MSNSNVSSPSQLSIEPSSISNGEITASPLASSNTVMSWVITVGIVISSIITFWVWVLVLPELSVKDQVTTVVPCAVIGKDVVVVPLIVPEQLSVAVGTVKLSTLHSAVTSSKSVISATGAETSSIITFWVWVLILPSLSVKVHVTSVLPWAVIGNTVVVTPITWPAQLSVAVGATKVSTLHSALTSSKSATSATGAVVSIITTVCVWVVILPSLSSKDHVTTVVPCAVIGNSVLVVPVIVPSQLSVAVGAVKTSTLHSAVTSSKSAISTTGAVISSIITFWVWVEIFPLASS